MADQQRQVSLKRNLQALGEREGASAAVQSLVKMLSSRSFEVRRAAAEALGEIGSCSQLEAAHDYLVDHKKTMFFFDTYK